MTDERQQLLRHAVKKTLIVCGALADASNAVELSAICRDPALIDRACDLIVNQMLRELAYLPTPEDFDRLLAELVTLAIEN